MSSQKTGQTVETSPGEAETASAKTGYGAEKMISPLVIGVGSRILGGRPDPGPDEYYTSGTLGCWLEVQMRDGRWVLVALTNAHLTFSFWQDFWTRAERPIHHRIRSLPGWLKSLFCLHKARCQGIKPDSLPTPGGMFEVCVQDENGKRHRLGSLWAASSLAHWKNGKRRRLFHDKVILDWALIKPIRSITTGNNADDDDEDKGGRLLIWDNKLPAPHEQVVLRAPDSNSPSDSTALRTGQEVFKKGSRTGLTSGFLRLVNGLEPKSSLGTKINNSTRDQPEETTSSEYCVVSDTTTPFGAEGDSGSVIWDKEGNLLGLVWGGVDSLPLERASGEKVDVSVCSFSPFADVKRDIIANSGGKILDVRVAQRLEKS